MDDPTTGKTVRVAAAVAHEGGLCDQCRGSVEHTVNDLTETWLALHMAIGDTARRNNQKVSISRSAPINLNTDADALKVAIVEWASTAASWVADAMNMSPRRGGPEACNNSDTEQLRALTACVKILAPNIDRLLEQEARDVTVWLGAKDTDYPGESIPCHTSSTGYRPNTDVISMSGSELGWKLVELRGKSRNQLDLTNDKLPLPCPRCNQFTLVRDRRTSVNGMEVDEVICGTCKFHRDYAHYQNLCERWVKDDEMEREKLQKQLDEEKSRREMAEWLLAKREWQLTLALDCTDVSASAYAATILADPNQPEADAYLNAMDVANLVGVSDSTVRSWASRGQITRHTADDGSTVYLASEVWEFAKTNTTPRTSTVRRLDTARRINDTVSP